MSDAREASWYEIALTHSQIVKIFVALLLCLVGAFFSGVWIGRDAAANVQEVGPVNAEAAEAATADGTELAQLNFFTDDDDVEPENAARVETPPPTQPAPAPQETEKETTLVEDLRVAEPEPTVVTQVVDAAPQASSPDAPVAVTREEPAAAAAADQTGELVVQVFSSNDATQARRVLGRLAQGGHPAYLSPVEVSGRTMYRVRIGPYSERSQAESVADSVRRAFKLDTWITQKST